MAISETKDFGQELAHARTRLGYDAKGMARFLSMSPSIYAQYESGERTPRQTKIDEIRKILGNGRPISEEERARKAILGTDKAAGALDRLNEPVIMEDQPVLTFRSSNTVEPARASVDDAFRTRAHIAGGWFAMVLRMNDEDFDFMRQFMERFVRT